MAVHATEGWPQLPVAAWEDTRDTVHMWTQIVGKIRLELMPMVNHWWQVPLYVDARGLTTGLMPSGNGGLEIAFDFVEHRLRLDTVSGTTRELALEPRSVADFHDELFARLRELDVDVTIYGRPVEVAVAIPFTEDHDHTSYDAERMHAFWRSLVSAQRVFLEFRARFGGKVSPVHFFWGAFDLAVTRFSGRAAPRHPGGVPNCPPWVMERAYSAEVSSCGYWPGGAVRGRSTRTPIPSPTTSGTTRWRSTARTSTTTWASSSSRTTASAPPPIPTSCWCRSSSRRTTPRPTWVIGTGRRSRSDRSLVDEHQLGRAVR